MLYSSSLGGDMPHCISAGVGNVSKASVYNSKKSCVRISRVLAADQMIGNVTKLSVLMRLKHCNVASLNDSQTEANSAPCASPILFRTIRTGHFSQGMAPLGF